MSDEPMDTEPTPPKPEPKPQAKSEPEPELPENKKLAQAEKELGNACYKKKDFSGEFFGDICWLSVWQVFLWEMTLMTVEIYCVCNYYLIALLGVCLLFLLYMFYSAATNPEIQVWVSIRGHLLDSKNINVAILLFTPFFVWKMNIRNLLLAGAIEHYNKAIEHDPTDITFYNNLAAVFFEQKEYDQCIEQCEKGVEIGRENRADFKMIAKALMRIGNAYKKKKDYRNARIFYEKSMSEHRTPEIRTLLSGVEKVIREEEKKSYINPELAEKEKEKGC